MTAPATRRRRRRRGSSCGSEPNAAASFGRPQAITHPVYGVNDLRSAVHCDLLTKPVDINLDKVGFAVEVRVPNVLHDLASRGDFRSARQEEFEQGEFF